MNIEVKLNGTTEEVAELLNAKHDFAATQAALEYAEEELRELRSLVEGFFEAIKGKFSLDVSFREYEGNRFSAFVKTQFVRSEDPWEFMRLVAADAAKEKPAPLAPGQVYPVPEGVPIEAATLADPPAEVAAILDSVDPIREMGRGPNYLVDVVGPEYVYTKVEAENHTKRVL